MKRAPLTSLPESRFQDKSTQIGSGIVSVDASDDAWQGSGSHFRASTSPSVCLNITSKNELPLLLMLMLPLKLGVNEP